MGAVYSAEFYCPSCRKFVWRSCKPLQRVMQDRCEKAGRTVKLRRRKQK